MREGFSLKERLFNRQKVAYLATLLTAAYPAFKTREFSTKILDKFPELALKQRISWIRKHLEEYLPTDFKQALSIILSALPAELDPNKTDNDFGDFIFAPFSDFIANNGLQNQYLDLSFAALAKITKRFSVEDSIRYFINQYPEQSFQFMQRMAHSDNYHQRRLASEGLRPKLPWGIGIDFDYQRSIQILDVLYADNTRFVLRSVANHLNDIAKFNADLVVQTLERWQAEGKQKNPKAFAFLIQHALRTLLKKGDAKAFKLLGFDPNPAIEINDFVLASRQIFLGEYLNFSFSVSSTTAQKLMLDYKVIYPSKTVKLSAKVFKIKQFNLSANKRVLIQKKHLFKPMTSKKLYPGEYQIQLQINGNIFAKDRFKIIIQ